MEQDANSVGVVDFNALILGFSSAALYYIGHSSIEGKAPAELNLPLAKQNIDIIKLLESKTKGNLSDDEEKLIKQILSDLTQKYAAAESSST